MSVNQQEKIKITWFGCASLKIECGGTAIWTDPFITTLPGAENATDYNTFSGAREILLSHGHFDHMISVPELYKKQKINVYCTKTPGEKLIKHGVPKARINLIAPGDSFNIGGAWVSVYQGEHIKFDKKFIAGVAWRAATSPRRLVNLLKMGSASRKLPEAGETVVLEIACGGKRVIFMGSPGLPEGADRPEPGADALIIAYQGNYDPSPVALSITEALRPKAVMFCHHDAAIPPLTPKQNVGIFIKKMREKNPDIEVIDPVAENEALL
ncbi:MAG: MBL fold metallo-hydrolase [Oscillospiraceae bacterium]|nr:MBL fold metallo-hydrolase [Oscillospiraceae bacterium]